MKVFFPALQSAGFWALRLAEGFLHQLAALRSAVHAFMTAALSRGQPLRVNSTRIPSSIHHTLSLDSPANPIAAKGVPLSTRMIRGMPHIARRKIRLNALFTSNWCLSFKRFTCNHVSAVKVGHRKRITAQYPSAV